MPASEFELWRLELASTKTKLRKPWTPAACNSVRFPDKMIYKFLYLKRERDRPNTNLNLQLILQLITTNSATKCACQLYFLTTNMQLKFN